MPQTYLSDDAYYQLIDDLNHLDPESDKHDYLERRDEIVQALAVADVWPEYVASEAAASDKAVLDAAFSDKALNEAFDRLEREGA